MLLYFNKEGKLTTITPHGDIPRQCGDLKIYVLFEKDYDLHNKQLWLRFKSPSKSVFEPDEPMTKELTLWEFKKLPGESVGNLVDGKKYQVFHIDLYDTLANKEAGNLEIVLTLYTVKISTDEEGNQFLTREETSVFGKTTIFIEETLGLAPYSGVGMTYSEYQTLINHINKLQEDVTTNRVGILRVGEYDPITGEIELTYDDEIVESIDYNEEDGILTITW